jgi:hypothetical protein
MDGTFVSTFHSTQVSEFGAADPSRNQYAALSGDLFFETNF